MTTYIGTATSRVDGRAKVTGAAKYAAEFNTPGLVHASVVSSTIPKGRIARIDASEAFAVEGVIDVLTHQNRPPMASADSAYGDDVAPEGSPFRPLYDDRVLFSGQPIALVVAEEPEIARFAASLVRVEYGKEAHITDVYRQREKAVALELAGSPFAPPKPRGTAEQALGRAEARHRAEYRVPIEHHNPMELFASTVIVEGDGTAAAADEEIARVEEACRSAGATDIRRAGDDAERDAIWLMRRELSAALKNISPVKLNNDVVVPRGRVPQLFTLVDTIRRDANLPIACFGHAGDGNIHVNIMVPPGDRDALSRAKTAERKLFIGVLELEGSISGEHGIGFTKAPYLGLELSADEIALMKRVKAAFDPHGILNPGKIFPDGTDR